MSVKLELGRRLESIVAEIFEEKGYKIERNLIIEGKSGEKNEFDIIAYKRNFAYVIECKNWQRKVSVKEIRDFIKKIEQCEEKLRKRYRRLKFLFISYSGFTIDASKLAKDKKIELWDGERLYREWYSIKVGQHLRKKEVKIIKSSLPIKIDIKDIIKLELINAEKLHVREIKIEFKPVWKILYSINKIVTLPDRSKQTILGKGVIWVDALTGKILDNDSEIVRLIGDSVPKESITVTRDVEEPIEIVDYNKGQYYDKTEIRKKIIEI